jgi:hypothetical protein
MSFKIAFVATCFGLTRSSSGNYQLEEITKLYGSTRQYYYAVSAYHCIWEMYTRTSLMLFYVRCSRCVLCLCMVFLVHVCVPYILTDPHLTASLLLLIGAQRTWLLHCTTLNMIHARALQSYRHDIEEGFHERSSDSHCLSRSGENLNILIEQEACCRPGDVNSHHSVLSSCGSTVTFCNHGQMWVNPVFLSPYSS